MLRSFACGCMKCKIEWNPAYIKMAGVFQHQGACWISCCFLLNWCTVLSIKTETCPWPSVEMLSNSWFFMAYFGVERYKNTNPGNIFEKYFVLLEAWLHVRYSFLRLPIYAIYFISDTYHDFYISKCTIMPLMNSHFSRWGHNAIFENKRLYLFCNKNFSPCSGPSGETNRKYYLLLTYVGEMLV